MTVAQNKIRLAQKVLQTENKDILKAIELIFTQEDEHFELTEEQKQELDKTLEEVESGKAKFYSMAEVRKRISKNHKKSKK